MKSKKYRKKMYINLSNKTGVFIHIPKAAGTSIYKSLGPNIVRYKKHCTALFVKNDISMRLPDIWDKLYKVSWVRNPWQRAVSLWKYTKDITPKGYAGIVSNPHFKKWLFDPKVGALCEDEPNNRTPLSALTYVSDLDGNIIVDFIGQLEHIDEDMSRLKYELYGRRSGHKVKHENNRKLGFHYTRLYDNESREYIADICKWEIDKFNYKFD
jgi:hypothetical protein